MTPLINLLNTILPGDWYEVDPFLYHRMFSDLPMYQGIVTGTFLNVGQYKVRVIRQTDDWYVEAYTLGERAKTEADLIRVVSESVAWLAIKQTVVDKPIPTVPAWAIEETGKQKGRKIGECDDRIARLYDEIKRTEEERERLRAYDPCIGP